MKTLILAALISAFYISVKAQCKDIEKSSNEFTQTVTYNSPQLNSDLVFYRVFVKGVKTTSIVAQCLSYALDYQVQGVYFKLDNGDILKNESAKSMVRYDGNNKYRYYIQFDLNNTDLQELISHKIVAYGIGSMILDVKDKNASKFQSYAICLNAINIP